jgi:hypothetical protein
MDFKELDVMSDEALIVLCVAPVIRATRGRDPETKARVFQNLRAGQRALFLFQVLYGHAGQGIGPFFEHISYLTEALDVWSALKSAFRYFGDAEMLALVEEMEAAFSRKGDLPLKELDARYAAQISVTIHRIATRIRNHPADFFDLES